MDDTTEGMVRALVSAFVFVAVVVALTLFACSCDRPAYASDAKVQAPLDCTTYLPPEYIDGIKEARLFADTRTGQRWWVLRMDGGQYVALPVDEEARGE